MYKETYTRDLKNRPIFRKRRHKKPTKGTKYLQKRTISHEWYKNCGQNLKDLKRPTKETYKRDLQKRPTKENYKREPSHARNGLGTRTVDRTFKRPRHKKPMKRDQ